MSVKVKIVVSMINLACLLATLAFPNDMTPFAVMITIVSVTAWAFNTYEDNEPSKKGLLLYAIGASLVSMICVILGICTNIKMANCKGVIIDELSEAFDHYVFTIKQGAFILSDASFDYTLTAMLAFAIVAIFSVIEIWATVKNNQAKNKIVSTHRSEPITVTIEKQIGHLR